MLDLHNQEGDGNQSGDTSTIGAWNKGCFGINWADNNISKDK